MPQNTFINSLDKTNFSYLIDPEIKNQIEIKLCQIEKKHNINILYACESGSRGWGFASLDSDYDVRFIYIHKLEWYLRVNPERNVIEYPINKLLDINGWDLRKALGLLKRGNATLIEWLSSPIIYKSNTEFINALREAAQAVHRPEKSFYHYLHMAQKNSQKHLKGDRIRLKKYLYVLRPLLAALWIEQKRGIVPMKFQDLVTAIVRDASLNTAIEELLIMKQRTQETATGESIPAISLFIEEELKRLVDIKINNEHNTEYHILDDLLRKTILNFSQ